MFTGTPEELRELKAKAQEKAEKVAVLLNELEELGSVGMNAGTLLTVGGAVVRRGGQWLVQSGR